MVTQSRPSLGAYIGIVLVVREWHLCVVENTTKGSQSVPWQCVANLSKLDEQHDLPRYQQLQRQIAAHGRGIAMLDQLIQERRFGSMPAIVRRTDRQRRTNRACSSGGGHDERPGNGRGRNKLQREDVRPTRHIRLVRRKVLADGLDDETPAGCPAGVALSTSRGERQAITSLEAPYVHSAHAARRTVGMHFFFLRRLGDHDFRREQQAPQPRPRSAAPGA
jgi:hypothetical protein